MKATIRKRTRVHTAYGYTYDTIVFDYQIDINIHPEYTLKISCQSKCTCISSLLGLYVINQVVQMHRHRTNTGQMHSTVRLCPGHKGTMH